MISKRKQKFLLALAEDIKNQSNYPFNPPVKFGAALLGRSGKVYLGVNVYVSPSNLGICSEPPTFYQAVLEGETQFKAIAIATVSDEIMLPCGRCLQYMAYFCGDTASSFQIIMGNKDGEIAEVYTLEELLPKPFAKTERRE